MSLIDRFTIIYPSAHNYFHILTKHTDLKQRIKYFFYKKLSELFLERNQTGFEFVFLLQISNIFYKILRKICIKLDTFCAYTGTSVFTMTTKMANREVLNTQKRKKSNVLFLKIPIKFKMSASEGVIPDIPGQENLPPLHLASYSAISADVPPTVSFKKSINT